VFDHFIAFGWDFRGSFSDTIKTITMEKAINYDGSPSSVVKSPIDVDA